MNNKKEIRSIWKLVALHLLPGAAFSAVYLFLLKTNYFIGLPKQILLSLAGCFSILPIELGILLYVSKKETGGFHIFRILGLRSNLKWKQYVLYSLALFLSAGVLMTVMKPVAGYLSDTVFQWIPAWYNYAEDLSQFSRSILVITILTNFLFLTLIGPITEELYFRGYLLARMKWMGKFGVVLNVVLFAAYHFWSPWLIPARIVIMLPLYYCVYRKDSLKLGIIVHCMVNFTDVVSLFALL